MLDGGGQVGAGDFVGALDLNAEVVERARCLGGVFDEHQFQRRIDYGEVGIAVADLGRLGGEQLGVEADGLVDRPESH
jgi:hypothetical protein